MAKKSVVAFCCADNAHLPEYEKMKNSLRKFYTEEELPLLLIDEDTIKSYADPMFFYRQKPAIGRLLLQEYELVIGLDCDQIITGRLDHIINDTSYDIGVVLNYNRVDPKQYGFVGVWDIQPTQYFNCGLVAMRNPDFVNKWWQLCMSPHFMNYQYKEQDLLNILCYYFDWIAKCFDDGDTWNGLIGKGEMHRFVLQDGKLICPPNPDGFPNKPMQVCVLHFAGGNQPNKFDYYRTHCSEAVIKYLDNLVKA